MDDELDLSRIVQWVKWASSQYANDFSLEIINRKMVLVDDSGLFCGSRYLDDWNTRTCYLKFIRFVYDSLGPLPFVVCSAERLRNNFVFCAHKCSTCVGDNREFERLALEILTIDLAMAVCKLVGECMEQLEHEQELDFDLYGKGLFRREENRKCPTLLGLTCANDYLVDKMMRSKDLQPDIDDYGMISISRVVFAVLLKIIAQTSRYLAIPKMVHIVQVGFVDAYFEFKFYFRFIFFFFLLPFVFVYRKLTKKLFKTLMDMVDMVDIVDEDKDTNKDKDKDKVLFGEIIKYFSVILER